MGPSDHDLINHAVGGDRNALSALLERYGPAVRRRFAHEIPHRWQSLLSLDDLMQETYTDAFLDISEFVPVGDDSFEAWLATIARHNLLNALQMLEAEKRGGNRQRVEVRTGEDSFVALYELLGAVTTTPSREAAGMEARSAIQQVIELLPDDYRRVVRMYDLEGRPMQEVSSSLNRRPGAVFMLRARAHRAMRRLLGNASRFLSGSA